MVTMSLKGSLFAAAIFLSSLPCLAQFPEESPELYIEGLFRVKTGDIPQMGWFVPLKGFTAATDSPSVFLLPPLGLPSRVGKKRPLTAEELKEIRNFHGEACELEGRQLFAFETGESKGWGRALYTNKAFPGKSRSGIISVPLDPAQLSQVNRRLQWPQNGTLRRDEAIAVAPGAYFYSIHKLYSPSTGNLTADAIVLHARDGRIVAHQLIAHSGEPECDSCAAANYKDPVSRGQELLLNVFELEGFAYPLLLWDSGTFEGAALSLFTFTPDGKPTTFRIYEYVMNCRDHSQ